MQAASGAAGRANVGGALPRVFSVSFSQTCGWAASQRVFTRPCGEENVCTSRQQRDGARDVNGRDVIVGRGDVARSDAAVRGGGRVLREQNALVHESVDLHAHHHRVVVLQSTSVACPDTHTALLIVRYIDCSLLQQHLQCQGQGQGQGLL